MEYDPHEIWYKFWQQKTPDLLLQRPFSENINNFFSFRFKLVLYVYTIIHHHQLPGLHKQTIHNNIQFDRIIFSLQRKLQLFIMALECREHVLFATFELEKSNSTTLFSLMKNPLDRSHLRNVNQPKAKSNDAFVVFIYILWIICWCAISHQKESAHTKLKKISKHQMENEHWARRMLRQWKKSRESLCVYYKNAWDVCTLCSMFK